MRRACPDEIIVGKDLFVDQVHIVPAFFLVFEAGLVVQLARILVHSRAMNGIFDHVIGREVVRADPRLDNPLEIVGLREAPDDARTGRRNGAEAQDRPILHVTPAEPEPIAVRLNHNWL
jgi:hypothetical protein